jgi:hypothetical protein
MMWFGLLSLFAWLLSLLYHFMVVESVFMTVDELKEAWLDFIETRRINGE